jgi:hypothetical protein
MSSIGIRRTGSGCALAGRGFGAVFVFLAVARAFPGDLLWWAAPRRLAQRAARCQPRRCGSPRRNRLPSNARRSVRSGVDRARRRRSRRASAGPALGAARLRAPAVRCRSQAWTARDADAVGQPARSRLGPVRLRTLAFDAFPGVDRARRRRSRRAGAGSALGRSAFERPPFDAGARRGPARNADAVGEPALVPPSAPSACSRPRSFPVPGGDPRAMPTQSASRRWSRPRRRPPSSACRSFPVPGVDPRAMPTQSASRRWSRPRHRRIRAPLATASMDPSRGICILRSIIHAWLPRPRDPPLCDSLRVTLQRTPAPRVRVTLVLSPRPPRSLLRVSPTSFSPQPSNLSLCMCNRRHG